MHDAEGPDRLGGLGGAGDLVDSKNQTFLGRSTKERRCFEDLAGEDRVRKRGYALD